MTTHGGVMPFFPAIGVKLRCLSACILALTLSAFAFPACAAHTDNNIEQRLMNKLPGMPNFTGQRRAQVVLKLTTPVSFGSFTLGNSGSVTVDPLSGSCTTRGGAVMIKPFCSRGVMELHGAPNEQVMVYLPSQATLDASGPGGQAVMRDFKMDRENPVMIGPDGKTVIGFGATLSGHKSMRAGQYSGQFPVETMVLK